MANEDLRHSLYEELLIMVYPNKDIKMNIISLTLHQAQFCQPGSSGEQKKLGLHGAYVPQ